MLNKKIVKPIIIIVCILLVLLFIILGLVFHNKPTKIDKKESTDITIDDKYINELSYSIPYSNNTMGVYKDAYSQDKTIINDVIGSAVITVTKTNFYDLVSNKKEDIDHINYLLKEKNLEGEKAYKLEYVNDLLTKRFNINLNTYDIPNGVNIIHLNNDYSNYIVIQFEKKDVLKQLKSVIDMNVYELNGEIIMNEKAVFIVLKGDTYYVYANTDINNGQEPLKVYNYDNRSIFEILESVKNDFKDYKATFRHTFRKNELGYYWYSTEMVN